MARKVTLFTRLLKGWTVARPSVPADATKVVELETGRNFGWRIRRVPTTPPAPVLAAIVAAPAVATVGEAYSGTTTGRTVGSTLALTGAGAAGLTIDGTSGAITGTPTAEGPVDVVETLAGATGSPRTSAAVITVSE